MDGILNVSKAMKCAVCGKYIISEEDKHKYDTCSSKCSQVIYRRIQRTTCRYGRK